MIALLLLSCTGPAGDTATAAGECPCGDADGSGSDTGDIPNVLGTWSSQLGTSWTEEGNCAYGEFDRDSEDWIGSFYVQGTAPGDLYVYFGPQSDPVTDRFYGAVDRYGGFTFSGIYDHEAGTLHAQFGGLVYDDPGLGRAVIRGSAMFGLDADGDTQIDCFGRASWDAYHSG